MPIKYGQATLLDHHFHRGTARRNDLGRMQSFRRFEKLVAHDNV
jgi:hypothetical protein